MPNDIECSLSCRKSNVSLQQCVEVKEELIERNAVRNRKHVCGRVGLLGTSKGVESQDLGTPDL